MTEFEKTKMAKELYNFQKAKKHPDVVQKNYLDEAIEALKAMVAAKTDTSFDEEYDEDDFYEEDAIVLYAEPGKSASLVEEEWAIDEIMIHRHISGFKMHFITEELMAVFPKDCVRYNHDGSVLVTGPLYICHPIICETEDANMDLTAVDLCEATAYLATHTVKDNKNSTGKLGFLLEEV